MGGLSSTAEEKAVSLDQTRSKTNHLAAGLKCTPRDGRCWPLRHRPVRYHRIGLGGVKLLYGLTFRCCADVSGFQGGNKQKSMMAVPRLKYSGGKLAPRSDLRVGADPGASPCASILNTHLGPPKKAGRPKNNHLQIDFCNIRGLNSNI